MEVDGSVGLFETGAPRLEDAGLEDCALPAQAIQEAFMRAADALQSVPWRLHLGATNNLGNSKTGDEFAKDIKGITPLGEEQSCVGAKAGGCIKKGSDLIDAPGAGILDGGKLVDGKESGPKLGDRGCVEGLPGDKGENVKGSSGEDEEGPILVLA